MSFHENIVNVYKNFVIQEIHTFLRKFCGVLEKFGKFTGVSLNLTKFHEFSRKYGEYSQKLGKFHKCIVNIYSISLVFHKNLIRES